MVLNIVSSEWHKQSSPPWTSSLRERQDYSTNSYVSFYLPTSPLIWATKTQTWFQPMTPSGSSSISCGSLSSPTSLISSSNRASPPIEASVVLQGTMEGGPEQVLLEAGAQGRDTAQTSATHHRPPIPPLNTKIHHPLQAALKVGRLVSGQGLG